MLDLRLGPVAKRLAGTHRADARLQRLGPRPDAAVRQGSQLTVHVTNDTDLETTVHWHGLRLENRYDGVPHETQQPIPPGGEFTYRLEFPDPGLYWYHPHIREDYTQEMGLYGNILVEPADPDYWPPAHRDVVLTLDDVLIEDGVIAPFSRTETNYAAMGRYGNVLLVGGETDLALTARTGEVVRLWLTNTANGRVFRVAVPGARMKLVGGDSGRVEHEEFVDDVLIAPSERAVVDVLFERPGEYALEHRTPDRTYPLAAITVTERGRRAAAARLVRTAARRPGARRRTPAARPVAGRAAGQDPRRRRRDGRWAGHGPRCGTWASDTGPRRHGHGPGHGPRARSMSHEMASMPAHDAGDGIEWEDDMVDMNRATTPANMRWQFAGPHRRPRRTPGRLEVHRRGPGQDPAGQRDGLRPPDAPPVPHPRRRPLPRPRPRRGRRAEPGVEGHRAHPRPGRPSTSCSTSPTPGSGWRTATSPSTCTAG